MPLKINKIAFFVYDKKINQSFKSLTKKDASKRNTLLLAISYIINNNHRMVLYYTAEDAQYFYM